MTARPRTFSNPAQLGFGPVASTPDDIWLWLDAVYNTDSGNNDEYMLSLTCHLEMGLYDYTCRYRYDGDSDWYVAAERGTATITESCGPLDVHPTSRGVLKSIYRR